MPAFMAIGRITVILALVLIENATLANHTGAIVPGPKDHRFYYYDPSEKLITSSLSQDPDCSRNQQWFCFNSTTKTHNCIYGSHSHIRCSDSGPLLKLGCCATYSEDTGLVTTTECPYFQMKGYNVTATGDGYYIQLPKTLNELNNSMCGPMNRKGIVCSECIDGFGPSVTSIGYSCANCTDAWYRVPLFLVLLFAPITAFYLFILIFQISMTSPPMPCFIMYAQVIVITTHFIDVENKSMRVIVGDRENLRLDAKILFTLYGIFNLDFFHYNVLPPFCISSQIKPIHIALLGYISVLYPIVMIFLTWLCVELHGYNFRPIVWLWRPFHRCCVKLWRSWDNKNDIIDVFATFFLLSYHKCLYQFVLLLNNQLLRNYNSTVGHAVEVSTYARTMADLNITAKSSQHIPYAVTAGITIILFYVLPTLLLMLYPIKVFRRLLSKCHLDFIALNIFVDKIHGDYKNGLNGGRDMRSLSGLYFILRIGLALSLFFHYYRGTYDAYIIGCVILLGCILIVAVLKPYNSSYMNVLDTLLLSNYLLIWSMISSGFVFSVVLTKLLITLPVATFILGIILKRKSNTNINNQANKIYCYIRILLNKARNHVSEGQQEKQPLVQSII